MTAAQLSPFDLLPYAGLPEKLIALALTGPSAGPPQVMARLTDLAQELNGVATGGVRVVVFGGGTGLSNIIGGDSRTTQWPQAPFGGLKQLFPQTQAIVCVTDDGGSTGELLKDLPLIAIGDLRHVLLSSIQKSTLQKQYDLADHEAMRAASCLHGLFNYRFARAAESVEALLAGGGIDLAALPEAMGRALYWLLREIFVNPHLQGQLGRPHCLGNLLVAAAIYQQAADKGASGGEVVPPSAIINGIRFLSELIGANGDAVLPCTTTPAHLKILYDNGVLVAGEHKSSQARRHCAVDRVLVEFAAEPQVPDEVLTAIAAAHIIVFAPGSLFTSIVPILQVPGIAAAIRENTTALKVLISNLWIQAGETDLAQGASPRRFHVSDLLLAYQRNIPGGIAGLFQQVMVMGLQEIPGSILQSYALENKVPIYLDRAKVLDLGFMPIEAGIYSQRDIESRRVIQHDPVSVARAVRTLWAIRDQLRQQNRQPVLPEPPTHELCLNPQRQTPSQRLRQLTGRLRELEMAPEIRLKLQGILWHHWDIPLAHLDFTAGVTLIPQADWSRCQEWDNVFSFYDPGDRLIKIREDVVDDAARFEMAFLVALGQSLLGDYALAKQKLPVTRNGDTVGYIYQITLREEKERHCFLAPAELEAYLTLSRMQQSAHERGIFTRLVSANEGFTPPGLLFGLTYAWYLDNQLALHVEYKMSIINAEVSDLVPEQVRIAARRQQLIDFFRSVVFRYNSPPYLAAAERHE